MIVDDDKDIRNLVRLYLANENYEILEAEHGKDALEKLDETVDLVMLDSMMPQMDGITTCLHIRSQGYTMPILFLSAKTEDADKLSGFSSGADDYITKPFNPIDLLARVKANLRRYTSYEHHTAKNPEETGFGDMIVNFSARTVLRNGEPVKLTKTEFSILELFLKNRGRVFNLEQIYANVWGDDSILNAESTVAVHVRNLRNKIEPDLAEPTYIKTVWGVGYRVD